MRPIFTLPLAALLLTGTACTTMPMATATNAGEPSMVAPILTSADAVDTLSYAQPQVARVTHVALDLALDFAGKSLGGTAVLDIAARDDAEAIVLDSNGLRIDSVTDGAGNALDYEIGAMVAEGGKGAPLTIRMGDARQVRIAYRAAENAEALQWLSPAQTAGGEHPYLFSQGQAILNRTWIPTQDSPGIRQTWEARITAPKPLTVVMSGIAQGAPEDLGNGRRAFRFEMDKSVPPYLIAIAAGDIEFRALSDRTGVWSEPSMLDAAAAEVADTERMVVAAEKLYGPYRWGRYDMIVLPPAFPYGGMENPVMTFLTPTFIAGDKSLNGLVAHELAHSWSGNLVTNAVWADSWLNEGVTSYFENRILEELYGKERAEQEAALAFANIEDTLAEVGNAPGTALYQPENVDPVGSAIIYDKGAYFLRTMESIVGRERFDAWLESWFDRHAFEPATSAMMLADIRANLVRGDAALEERLMLDEWVYGPGLPGNVARPAAGAFAEVDAAVAAYPASGPVASARWASWNSAERQRYLRGLPQEIDAAGLAAMDRSLGLTQGTNNEELFLWLNLALANRYDAVVPRTEAFLANVGRRKFVAPLFATLMGEGEWGQPIARRIYARTRPSYHAVTTGTVDRIVNGS